MGFAVSWPNITTEKRNLAMNEFVAKLIGIERRVFIVF